MPHGILIVVTKYCSVDSCLTSVALDKNRARNKNRGLEILEGCMRLTKI